MQPAKAATLKKLCANIRSDYLCGPEAPEGKFARLRAKFPTALDNCHAVQALLGHKRS